MIYFTDSIDLINSFCSTCKTTTKNFSDKLCRQCHSRLLYQCFNCKCIYKKLIGIQNHLKYDCLNDTIFYCNECNYSSPMKLQLLKHIQKEHSSLVTTSTYNCSKCNKKFQKLQNMQAHEKMCGLEPILQCKYCLFRTKSKSSYSWHLRNKHPEHDSQNYHCCSKCGKKYKNLNTLNHHIKYSCEKSPLYHCDHCEFKIDLKYKLSLHMQKCHPLLYSKVKLNNKQRDMYIDRFIRRIYD